MPVDVTDSVVPRHGWYLVSSTTCFELCDVNEIHSVNIKRMSHKTLEVFFQNKYHTVRGPPIGYGFSEDGRADVQFERYTNEAKTNILTSPRSRIQVRVACGIPLINQNSNWPCQRRRKRATTRQRKLAARIRCMRNNKPFWNLYQRERKLSSFIRQFQPNEELSSGWIKLTSGKVGLTWNGCWMLPIALYFHQFFYICRHVIYRTGQ